MNYKEKELDIEREIARNLCHVLSSLYTLVIRTEDLVIKTFRSYGLLILIYRVDIQKNFAQVFDYWLFHMYLIYLFQRYFFLEMQGTKIKNNKLQYNKSRSKNSDNCHHVKAMSK